MDCEKGPCNLIVCESVDAFTFVLVVWELRGVSGVFFPTQLTQFKCLTADVA